MWQPARVVAPSDSFLARQRTWRGLTTRGLAELSGVDKGTINRLEEPGPPHGELRTWLILAKALDVNLLAILQPEWHSEPLPTQRLRRGLPADAPPDLS